MSVPPRVAAPFLLLLLAVAGLAADETDLAYQDFRGGRFPRPLFTKVGRDPDRLVRTEVGGLRITLPAGPKAWPQTGFSPRFPVSGEFDVIVSYEILNLETPKNGYGSGVMLWVLSSDNQGAAITRSHRVQEGNVYSLDRASPNESGKLHHDVRFLPTSAQSGRLRLRRTGETLHYLAAEGADGEFSELRQEPFSSADLKAVLIAADPGGSPTALDVLIPDVRFRGEERKARSGWIWLAGLGALALLGSAVAAVGAVRWWKRRRRSAASRPGPGRPGKDPSRTSARTPSPIPPHSEGNEE